MEPFNNVLNSIQEEVMSESSLDKMQCHTDGPEYNDHSGYDDCSSLEPTVSNQLGQEVVLM
jgi:hypothetical protein